MLSVEVETNMDLQDQGLDEESLHPAPQGGEHLMTDVIFLRGENAVYTEGRVSISVLLWLFPLKQKRMVLVSDG